MSCPHGNGPPTACSQCIGAAPRLVTRHGDTMFVDGVPVCPHVIPSPMETDARKRARSRGGRSTAARRPF